MKLRSCPFLRFGLFALPPWCILSSTACPGPVVDTGYVTEIEQLKEKNLAQSRLVQQRDEQIRNLSQQIRRLTELPQSRRLDVLPRVQRIELASLSGGYDDNDDGIDEGVVLYLRPIDQDEDTIKAAGTLRVVLTDPTSDGDRIVVGEADLGLEVLRKAWYGRLSSHFTVRIPWSGGAERPPSRTVLAHVQFSEYLTGRPFDLYETFDVSGAAARHETPAER